MAVRKPQEIVDLLQQATDLTRDLMQENAELRRRLGEAEVQSQKFADRYATVSEQSELLQNLFVVMHRLHGSMDRAEVLSTIKETVINLVGSEDFAIWSADETGPRTLLAHEGDESAQRGQPDRSKALVQKALAGEPYFRPESSKDLPAVVLALNAGGRVVGLILVRSLLPQKAKLTDADQQLLDLLASQGAAALMSAALFDQASSSKNGLKLEVSA